MISIDHVEMYKDVASKWRWRYRSSNGRTMADSSQGYTRKFYCIQSMQQVLNSNELPDHPPVVIRKTRR